ncbi:MAG TPA: zinc-ribbon domain-containing protein [Devosia sp.]
MAAPQPKTVVIICPHCSTRYQVPADTIGAKGRQVQCAHCGKAWQAHAEKVIEPPPLPKPVPVPAPRIRAADADEMFDPTDEAELDAEFEAEQRAAAEAAVAPPAAGPETELQRSIEEIKAAIAPKAADSQSATKSPDPVAQKKRQKAFDQRQDLLTRQLPLARVRRILRVTGLVTLALLIGIGFSLRTDIVRLFPDLAGTYEALGLGVNVVGLEFRDVKTLLALRRGADVMQVDARIYSVAAGTTPVPPVVVTLLNDAREPLYEWSVQPETSELQSGQVVDFTTQITAPPAGATRVRLSFARSRVAAAQAKIVPVPQPAAAPSNPAPAQEAQH